LGAICHLGFRNESYKSHCCNAHTATNQKFLPAAPLFFILHARRRRRLHRLHRRRRRHKHLSSSPYFYIADDEAIKIPSSPSILADANCSFGGHRRSCCCVVFFFFLWGRRVPTTSCQAADSCPSMHAAAASSRRRRYVFFTLPCTPLMCRRQAAVAALSWHLTATKRKQSECKMRQLLQLLQDLLGYCAAVNRGYL
jgi:hypothetical protein